MLRVSKQIAVACLISVGWSTVTHVSADETQPESRINDYIGDLDPKEPTLADLIRGARFDREYWFETDTSGDGEALLDEISPLKQASMLQPMPFLEPRVAGQTPQNANAASMSLSSRIFSEPTSDQSLLRQARSGVNTRAYDFVQGTEATPLVSTDVGSLLRKSPAALSVGTQRRSPIVNESRVRGSRIGSLAASGSYWVPARADLDTALSKIDSRIIENVLIIPGPYSSLYGPGHHFVDFELVKSPRSASGLDWNGRTCVDYNSNGNQWLGQQSLWGGGEDWGIHASYLQRTGSDYTTGDGSSVPAEYNSSVFTLAMGRDFGDGRSLELSLIRLSQSDVDFPGYVFGIDRLTTDAYGATYIDANPTIADYNETELWYNNTSFVGRSQDVSALGFFPLLDRLAFQGTTDVESISTGYRRANSWKPNENCGFVLGHDMRFVKQELNESNDGLALGFPIPFDERNSPIPRSFSVNPGLFAEYRETLFKNWTFRSGGRLDYVQTDVVDDRAKLDEIGLGQIPATYEEIVGTDQTQTDRFLWSLYGAIDRRFNDSLKGTASLGFAQRPPNLTELYAAQPFLWLLQSGLSDVTGDPLLENEKLIQADLSLDFDGEYLRAGVRGFYGWSFDYITFEAVDVTRGPPVGDIHSVSLRYVNTALATLVGGEVLAELFPKERLSPFMTMRGVDGRDRTRNGDFATTRGESGFPTTRQPGLDRGFFSGIVSSDSEPLPGISPFETRIGVRLRDNGPQPAWNVELAARIVDNQDRVATSLLESPTAGFTIWDIRGICKPSRTKDLTIVAGIENFANKTYREHLGFRSPNGVQILEPGINVYFGSEWIY